MKERFPLMFLIVPTFFNRIVVCLFVYIVLISFVLWSLFGLFEYIVLFSQLAWWLSLRLCTTQKVGVLQLIVFASIPFQIAFTFVPACCFLLDCHFIVVIIKRNCLNFFVNNFQYVCQSQFFSPCRSLWNRLCFFMVTWNCSNNKLQAITIQTIPKEFPILNILFGWLLNEMIRLTLFSFGCNICFDIFCRCIQFSPKFHSLRQFEPFHFSVESTHCFTDLSKIDHSIKSSLHINAHFMKLSLLDNGHTSYRCVTF